MDASLVALVRLTHFICISEGEMGQGLRTNVVRVANSGSVQDRGIKNNLKEKLIETGRQCREQTLTEELTS